jgi:hypothetical protein
LLRDEIRYAPPLGWLGRRIDPLLIRPRLRRMFEHRHAVTRREVLAMAQAGGSVSRPQGELPIDRTPPRSDRR